ncbi:enoyl-CoA hydratase/isomerase family protein, partial [Phenylobacterium sp.]|uniref:enoyl-CoA hydratase/isomerase family protein n=1 Tax=Phenylobacterium sp. TaxID=1871053 RepID=UPI0039836B34
MDELFDTAWRHLKVTRDQAIVEVALARTEARNALNGELMDELTQAARLLRLRTDVHAVILTGAETYFSAGADLAASAQRVAQPSLLEARRAVMAGPDLCRAWEEIEAVTIAAIEGYCIGGACALAVACDFRIMGQGAYMRLPEVPLGMNMSWRTLPRLVALAGPSRAKQFVMFGEAADAQRCADWGMADELAAQGQALTAARVWAAKVVALPPLSVRMTKEAVSAVAAATSHASIYMDRDQYLLATKSA